MHLALARWSLARARHLLRPRSPSHMPGPPAVAYAAGHAPVGALLPRHRAGLPPGHRGRAAAARNLLGRPHPPARRITGECAPLPSSQLPCLRPGPGRYYDYCRKRARGRPHIRAPGAPAAPHSHLGQRGGPGQSSHHNRLLPTRGGICERFYRQSALFYAVARRCLCPAHSRPAPTWPK